MFFAEFITAQDNNTFHHGKMYKDGNHVVIISDVGEVETDFIYIEFETFIETMLVFGAEIKPY